MESFEVPTIVSAGSDDPKAPLVILLHGRGSTETEIITLASYLPKGVRYVALRAPIAEGAGYAWFANKGIGRPLPESISKTMGWFYDWLDGFADHLSKIVLIGFSGGAAFGGGLILNSPKRFTGAAILYGTLPFDAGIDTSPQRLANTNIFLARGELDNVIPRDLLDRTWSYLNSDAGSNTVALLDKGGHGISERVRGGLVIWLGEILGLPEKGMGWIAPGLIHRDVGSDRSEIPKTALKRCVD